MCSSRWTGAIQELNPHRRISLRTRMENGKTYKGNELPGKSSQSLLETIVLSLSPEKVEYLDAQYDKAADNGKLLRGQMGKHKRIDPRTCKGKVARGVGVGVRAKGWKVPAMSKGKASRTSRLDQGDGDTLVYTNIQPMASPNNCSQLVISSKTTKK
ncbi:hypothetical protein BASA60_006504, partial [Batrachochytrium salamandrivorans]